MIFLKDRTNPKVKLNNQVTPTGFKTQLDIVEKDIYAKLKPVGFKKNDRTFNRRLDDGIVQVINDDKSPNRCMLF